MTAGTRAVAARLRDDSPTLRYRWGTIVYHDGSTHTCTITLGGSDVEISEVRYAAHLAPVPGATCYVATDGSDLFVAGMLAGDGPPLAPTAYVSADVSIPNATDTVVTWASSAEDPWGAWDPGAANRLDAPMPGRYLIIAAAQFAAAANGIRAAWITVNGSEVARVQSPTAGAAAAIALNLTSPPITLGRGDEVQLLVRQTSGGALALQRLSTTSPSLSLVYLGP